MLRILLTSLLISLCTAAQALPTGAELRAMAYAGDVAAIDDAVAAAQAEVVAGTANPDDLRLLVSGLTGTDPVLLAFTETWLAERPDSPYAHIVRAWQLYNNSWAIRGTQTVQWVWPPAMDLFQQAQWEGMEHAVTAYQLAPDLIPASDAILRMQKTTKLIPAPMFTRFFEEIMARHRDTGTLFRALELTNPAWGGGGLPAVQGLCREHARNLMDIDGMTPEICIIVAVWENEMAREWPEVHDRLLASTSPLLRYHRAKLAAQLGRPEDRDWLHRYILQDGITDIDMAMDFDVSYATEGQISPVGHIVHQRARDRAREVLAYDPYNRAMLNVMVTRPPRTIGYITYPTEGIDAPLSNDELLDYQFDIVTAAPYDATAWQALARLRAPEWPDRQRPYEFTGWANAIAYSNHYPYTLLTYVQDMAARADEFQRIAERGLMPVADLVAIRTPYVCEAVRADRLHTAVCDAVGQGFYGCDAGTNGGYFSANRIADLITEAQAGGMCLQEFSGVLNDLIYEPVSIPRP